MRPETTVSLFRGQLAMAEQMDLILRVRIFTLTLTKKLIKVINNNNICVNGAVKVLGSVQIFACMQKCTVLCIQIISFTNHFKQSKSKKTHASISTIHIHSCNPVGIFSKDYCSTLLKLHFWKTGSVTTMLKLFDQLVF